MREILFRGKRIDNGEWVQGDLIREWKDGLENFGQQECFIKHLWVDENWLMTEPHKVIPTTVGQYTGLTDKNGTKIFEGDVCKDVETGKIYTIIYERNNFIRTDESGYYFWVFDTDCFEVIGNIHDNPVEEVKQ